MQRALTRLVFPAAHGGRLVLVAALMGLLAAAVLAAGDTAQAQTTPTTYQITTGTSAAELTTSLNQVWASNGNMVAGVNAGDTIEFGPGVYEDIGRNDGRLNLSVANLTVRGASDPRRGGASGRCDPRKDTILTGASGFGLEAANITLENFCFQDFDVSSSGPTSLNTFAPISLVDAADGATVRRNRIDNTIGYGLDARTRVTTGTLTGITISENEFIDIGLIKTTDGSDGASVQPRDSGAEPSAIRLDTSHEKTNLKITGNLFDGSAWVAVNLTNVQGGTISGNTVRNQARSGVSITGSSDITLDNNTYEGNNRVAWRVFAHVATPNWMNDLKVGPWGPTVTTKLAAMESAELQTLLRLTKAEAAEVGMAGALYDTAVARVGADKVYLDPHLSAAVKIKTSTEIVISNSTFTNNHNSVGICAEYVCRVEGLEEVGGDGNTGRSPAYISPNAAVTGPVSTVTLKGNQFNNSDTRSDDRPGSVGNHLVIGYFRDAATTAVVGEAAGAFTYGAGNSFAGSGVFGGAVADDISTISIESESTEAVVEGTNLVFNLTIAPPALSELTVHYSVSEEGSFAGTLPDDDPTLDGAQITVAGGATSAVLTIPTVADSTIEADGSITVTIDAGDFYLAGATATVNLLDGPPPFIPPPIIIPPPPEAQRAEAEVKEGAATVEANDVTIDLSPGALPEEVESVEVSVTKLNRAGTPPPPSGARFRIPGGATYDIELTPTVDDETSEPLTELAATATVCLPIPVNVQNPVVLRYEAESDEWVKLRPAPSPKKDEVCAVTDSFSVYAVADEADHGQHLSATRVNDFSRWEGDYPLTASELLSALPGVDSLWVWNGEEWIGYATMKGEPLPGAQDFVITPGDTLWLGNGVSGRDTGEEGEEGEG